MRLEKELVKELQRYGLNARRQPGSGIYADFPHDVELEVGGHRFIVECKARANGFATLDRWMGQADLLVVKADRQVPMVWMSVPNLVFMIGLDRMEEVTGASGETNGTSAGGSRGSA